MNRVLSPSLLIVCTFIFFNSLHAQEELKDYSLVDTSYADSLILKAEELFKIGKAESGLKLASQAKEVFVEIYGESHSKVALAWSKMGTAYYYLRKLESSINCYEKSYELYLVTKGPNYFKIGEIYNDLGVINTSKGNFLESLKYHKKALNFKEKYYPDNLKPLCSSLGNIGATYQYLSVIDSAMYFHNRSLELRKQVYGERSEEVADALNSLGSASGQGGNYENQIFYLSEALKIFEDIVEDTHRYRILCYTNLGFAYKNFGDFPKTLFYHHLALELHKKKSGPNSIEVAIAYNNLSTDYLYAGKNKLAKESIEKAFKSIPKDFPTDHPHLASFYNVLARCYSEQGDGQKAIATYEKALNIAIKKYGENHTRLMQFYSNLGSQFRHQKEYEKAIEYFHKAEKVHLQNFNELHPDAIYFYGGIGSAHTSLKNFVSARKYLQKVIDIESQLDSGYSAGLSNAHANMAWVDFYESNYSKSTMGFMKAIQLAKKESSKVKPKFGYLYYSLAKSYSAQRDYTLAEEAFLSSLKEYEYFVNNDFEQTNKLEGLISSLQAFGEHYQKKYNDLLDREDLKKSESYFVQACNAIDYKASIVSPDSKNETTEISNNIYTHRLANAFSSLNYAHNATVLNTQYQKMLELSEKSKAYILRNAFTESNALKIARIPENFLTLEYNLRLEIAALEKLKNLKRNLPDTLRLNYSNQIAVLKDSSEFLKTQFERDYPNYFNARYNQTISTIQSVRKEILTDNQTLIEYTIGDSISYLILVNPDTFLVHQISMDFPLKNWVKEFTEGLTKFHTTQGMPKSMLSKYTENYVLQANQLYDKFIGPVSQFLNDKVIIIPDGVLGYIPFEVLLSKQPEDLTAFNKYPYFMENHTISYCYSATLLEEMKNKVYHDTTRKTSLSVAPFFKGDISSTLAKIDSLDFISLRSDTLRPLPFSGEEAVKVATITAGDYWLGTEASLSKFTDQAPNYRILHLSTHGLADDKIGDYAYLAFRNQMNNNEYEKLLVRDIYNIPLNADMVVLSACKSAYGKLQKGEGIISMARAFAYAGSKSILTSHWSIDDKSTGIIMENFYGQLAQGKTKDEAIRTAKLEYIKDNKGLKAHPFFWAAFIGIGDMSPIQE